MRLASIQLDRFEALPPLSSGAIESLKWLAVIFMTVDHVNLLLLNAEYPLLYGLGRLALPLFVFVLAYNLAQPRGQEQAVALRVLRRLVPIAVLSTLPYMELTLALFGWRPLNVLFTLAAGTAFVALMAQPTRWRTLVAILLYAVSGALVDYGWTGTGLFVCCWYLFRRPTAFWAASTTIFLLLLCVSNSNLWALAAVPIIGVAFFWRLGVPRLRHALYYYYPLHLAVIANLKIVFFGL